MTMRWRRLPVPRGVERGPAVLITIDGHATSAHLGESVAAALLAEDGDPSTRTTSDGENRGLFCGMGACFDCLVVVDGIPGTRACVTWICAGMDIARQNGPGYRREARDQPKGDAAH